MTGVLTVLGLGPGGPGTTTPEASAALETASDIVGYTTYTDRVSPRPSQRIHASDNRVEADRAHHALTLAAEGRSVAVVSSGDPGVFAMAAVVCEAIEAEPAAWGTVELRILPGVTAMLAAAARAGAPLGHDFCAINLSDNLKPAALVEKRLRLAAEADFAMALYNPRSKARPDGFDRALRVLREACDDDRPVIFARAVTRPDETLSVVPLPQATAEMADMQTVVIVGSSATRVVARPAGPLVYTPRAVPA
ncbi:MAG: precorrin-3B C(17)-methyltransferase [Pseudomonadota bacterium]